MYLSVQSTQPGCFLKAPAVQQCAGLVADPRQVSRLMLSSCFVARDGLLMEECQARLGLSWTPRVSSNVTLLLACWTSKGGELGKLW